MTYILHLVFRFLITFIRRTNYQTKFSSVSSENRQKRKMAIARSQFFFVTISAKLCNIRKSITFHHYFGPNNLQNRTWKIQTWKCFHRFFLALVRDRYEWKRYPRPVSNPRAYPIEAERSKVQLLFSHNLMPRSTIQIGRRA